MKQISELVDFRQVFIDAAQPAREYNKQSDKKYNPQTARFKLVCWFKNGKTRYFYSFDNKHFNGAVHLDEQDSLMKLCRLVNKCKGEYKNAIIYATFEDNKLTTGQYNFEVAKWDMYGNLRTNKSVNFLTTEKNVLLNIKNCKLYGNEKIK